MSKKLALTVVDAASTGFQPPRPLGEHGAKLWHAVQREYKIADCGGIELLAQIAGAVDRLESIAARIADDGPVIRGRSGPRAHPLLREETALRGFVCRALQRLGVAVPVDARS
jgi:hypothetical protein